MNEFCRKQQLAAVKWSLAAKYDRLAKEARSSKKKRQYRNQANRFRAQVRQLISDRAILHHRTWADAANAIHTDGFRDGDEGCVWFSEHPLDWDEIRAGDCGEVVLGISVPSSVVKQFLHHRSKRNGSIVTMPATLANRFRKTMVIAEVDCGGLSSRQQFADAIVQRRKQGPPIPGKKLGSAEALQDLFDFLEKHRCFDRMEAELRRQSKQLPKDMAKTKSELLRASQTQNPPTSVP